MPHRLPEVSREYHRVWKLKKKDENFWRIRQYLQTHPCVDCGEKDPVVLDFDHKNPDEKVDSISHLRHGRATWEDIWAEIQKCEVRCANCHRKKHYTHPIRKERVVLPPMEHIISPEGLESIRQSKLGIARSDETKAKISESLKGNHCRPMLQLAGRRFGRLVVTEKWEKRGGRIWWLCRCDCDSPEKWIKSIKLTTGKTQSCGCLRNYYYGNGSPSVIENSGNPRARAGAHQLESTEVCACSLD